MACQIVVTNVTGQESDPGQGIDTLTVRGTAVDCADVCVSVEQTQPVSFQTGEKTAHVAPDGTWSTQFTSPDDFPLGTFLCGRKNKYVARAVCCADRSCEGQDSNVLIECTGACPTASVAVAPIDRAASCNPDGTRTISVTANITLGTASPVALSLSAVDSATGSETFGPSGSLSANGQFPANPWQLSLVPGTHRLKLTVIIPDGCPGAEVELVVPGCPAVPTCPHVDWDVEKPCNKDGQRVVTVFARIHSDATAAYSAQLRDQAGTILDSGNSAGGDLDLESPPEVKTPGDYDYNVHFTNLPAGVSSCDVTNEIRVLSCDKATPTPPKDNNGTDRPPQQPDIAINFCLIARILFLIGLGIALVGLVFLLCPALSGGLLNPVASAAIVAIGALLFLIFFVIWLAVCRPSPCDWLLLLWQVLALAGMVFTYASLCPMCLYMAWGLLLLAAALGVFAWWIFACRPTPCRIYGEVFMFSLFVVDVTNVVEGVLAQCIITQVWYYALIWAAGLLAVDALAVAGLRRNRCRFG